MSSPRPTPSPSPRPPAESSEYVSVFSLTGLKSVYADLQPPPSKRRLVVRQLPPSYAESEFREQMIKPFEQWIDHWSFIPGKEQRNITSTTYLSSSDLLPRYATGYAAFTDPRQLLEFAKRTHGRRLCDEAGREYEVLVDTAAYQLIPSSENDVVDELEGTLGQLPEFQAYMAREEPKCEPVTLEALQASLVERQKVAPLVEHLKAKVFTSATQATPNNVPTEGKKKKKKKKSKASTSAASAEPAKPPTIKIASRTEKKTERRASQVGQLAAQTATMALKDSTDGQMAAPAVTGDRIQALGKEGTRNAQTVQSGSSKTADGGSTDRAVQKQHATSDPADICRVISDMKPSKKVFKTINATPATEATMPKASSGVKPVGSEIKRQEEEALVRPPDQVQHEEKQRQPEESKVGHAGLTSEELLHEQKAPKEELKIFNTEHDEPAGGEPRAAQGESIQGQAGGKAFKKQLPSTKPPRPLQSTTSKKHPHSYTEDDRKWILDAVHQQQHNSEEFGEKSTDARGELQQSTAGWYIELGGDPNRIASVEPPNQLQLVFPSKEAPPKKAGTKKKGKAKPKGVDEPVLSPTKQPVQAPMKIVLRKESGSSLPQNSSSVFTEASDRKAVVEERTVQSDAASKAPANKKVFKTKSNVVSSLSLSQANTASSSSSVAK